MLAIPFRFRHLAISRIPLPEAKVLSLLILPTILKSTTNLKFHHGMKASMVNKRPADKPAISIRV